MYPIKNVKIPNVGSDTGWIVNRTGRCVTHWIRYVEAPPEAKDSIIEFLIDERDFPGWSGVEYAVGLNKNGLIAFTSTWDSSD